jgi:hypothetical protein
VVETTQRDEFHVCSGLADAPMVEYHDAVDIVDRREPVRDH